MSSSRTALSRCLAVYGAVLAALAVALAAYAAHGLEGEAQSRVALASLFAFAHGLALQVLPFVHRMAQVALLMLALGVSLFSVSLLAAVWFGTNTLLAPVGGLLMIAGWLLKAVDAGLRR